MFSILVLLLLTTCHSCQSARCGCTDVTCDASYDQADCYGDYCWGYRPLATMGVNRKGCFSTRQEMPSNFTCEEDRNSGILCICKGDFCNSASLATSPVVKAPTVLCSKRGDDHDNSYTCRGHGCMLTQSYTVNKYGDMVVGSIIQSCTESYSIRIINSFIDISDDFCYLSVYSNDAQVSCICKTNYCTDRPIPEITLGKVNCYTYYYGRHGKCRGEYCFATYEKRKNGIYSVRLGCISLPNGIALSENKTTSRNGETHYVCSEDFCNGFPLRAARNVNIGVLFLTLFLVVSFSQ